MKFSYSHARQYLNLVLGILWTFIGTSYFFDEANMRWNHYLSIVIGLLYLVMFTYEYFNKYFEINNGKIKLFSIPSEEILVSEIYDVKYYAGDYIFKTADKTIKIVKSQINKKQLSEFEDFYNNISKELEKNVV